jgi:O-acetyl-ADP-ribose deacetylase (regulator of RNase III)
VSTLGNTILATAFVSLAIGLSLYVYNAKKSGDRRNLYATNLICWLLIALFPALIIFSFFPQSSMLGNIFGFSMGGAVALFVFTWWFGSKMSLLAVNVDDLNNQIRSLQEDIEKNQELLSKGSKVSTPTALSETRTYAYKLKRYPRKQIALITGNIQGVKCADIWVNSENTNMQMSRYFERSISGTIRYLGARKDVAGDVVEDLVFNELSRLMSTKTVVQPATVFSTDSGELEKSHRVKKIFHVAAVRGQVGSGYNPVDNIEFCVRNALEKTEAPNIGCKSILFPLLGTGTAKGTLTHVASTLITSAIEFLESKEDTSIQCVYFLNWTDCELEACKRVLDECDRVEAKRK